MTPNLNIANFARMAHPSAASAPQQGYGASPMSRPPMPMPPRPPMNPASRMAAQGRGGDSMMAHMTPGEIAVPPQVQTPEVLAALNRAFAQVGANPTSYQAGSPDQKVNPDTGAPEFGFFDIALPLALGVAGSMFLGPEVLAPALEAAGVGATTSGLVGGAIGGGLGSAAGNVIAGKPLGYSLASGAAGAAGSALLGGALGGFGSGPTPMAEVGPGAGVAADSIRDSAGMASLPNGGLNATGAPLTASGSAASSALSAANIDKLAKAWEDSGGALTQAASPGPIAAPDRSWGDWISDKVGNMDVKQTIGSALGGQIGSALIDDYFPAKAVKPDLGPSMTPLKDLPPLSTYIGGGSKRYPAARYPDSTYRPGVDSQFRYFG